MTTTTQQLDADQWVQYFDSIAPSVEGLHVTIEVMSEQLGDQAAVERLPLQAIGYDPRDDVLEVAVGGRGLRYPVVMRHFISAPRTISFEQSAGPAPSAILVTDASGVGTLMRLFEPAALEA